MALLARGTCTSFERDGLHTDAGYLIEPEGVETTGCQEVDDPTSMVGMAKRSETGNACPNRRDRYTLRSALCAHKGQLVTLSVRPENTECDLSAMVIAIETSGQDYGICTPDNTYCHEHVLAAGSRERRFWLYLDSPPSDLAIVTTPIDVSSTGGARFEYTLEITVE
ncbi:MAG: hypothetical protein H0U74_09120 [Bradymonadaceae bacterium]|nr:hypothetical protein [Lujinxingiaceae bacterium]